VCGFDQLGQTASPAGMILPPAVPGTAKASDGDIPGIPGGNSSPGPQETGPYGPGYGYSQPPPGYPAQQGYGAPQYPTAGPPQQPQQQVVVVGAGQQYQPFIFHQVLHVKLLALYKCLKHVLCFVFVCFVAKTCNTKLKICRSCSSCHRQIALHFLSVY